MDGRQSKCEISRSVFVMTLNGMVDYSTYVKVIDNYFHNLAVFDHKWNGVYPVYKRVPSIGTSTQCGIQRRNLVKSVSKARSKAYHYNLPAEEYR
ncbi:hypothetical protein RRF57_010629 [Xylaria bambusicola]|uniref:Uncharacterized protein n=1 Tax=Xylaria bambusicola TaxID=326684 RepID=A0AAN7USR1_9PEZI